MLNLRLEKGFMIQKKTLYIIIEVETRGEIKSFFH